ncbi:MAG: tRNA (adenosine(37)-N6)-dimethylallyltransferase MiaA [Myxococcota bacterium]|nr:tRNA (adenosine(37)-N6)-dimethylallyltransferase MiaA [Myxococcota bacterium]
MVPAEALDERPVLLCIVGQTASGKSALALDLAEEFGLELLSVDCMQVYRGFDIGTAKPDAAEQARVAHHGIDLVGPEETFSAGAFLHYARDVIARAESRGARIIAVGGTGLYFRAMLHGLAPSAPADPEFRSQLREQEQATPGSGHRRLLEVDPVAGARIHPNDWVRIERALEVFETTGETQSRWLERHAWGEAPFRTRLLGIRWERAQLRQRIAARLEQMFETGWIEEVRALLEAGVTVEMTPMLAVGYREIVQHLRGELGMEELRERILASSLRFAKHQGTWFNREPSIQWMEPGPDLVERTLPIVRSMLEDLHQPREQGD